MKKIIAMVFFLTLILSFGNSVVAIAGTNDGGKIPNSHERAKSTCLIDFDTGSVLLEHNANEKSEIASMVKIMTLLLAFENIQDGYLSLDQKIMVSENASGMGGSQIYIKAGDMYTISDLIKGIIVCSANDASIAIAEAISGSEATFVELMNKRAQELKMNDTIFVNATGLPGDNQYSTARDVSIMMCELLKHNEYLNFSSIQIENFLHPDGRITELVNTNKLIRNYKGCDAGKTGFTNSAAFCLSASAKRANMRLVATVIGASDSKIRFREVASLFNHGFANYIQEVIINKDDIIENTIDVKKGEPKQIQLRADKSIKYLRKKGDTKKYHIDFQMPNDLKAPIDKGAILGRIIVSLEDGTILDEANIIAECEIKVISLKESIKKVIDDWFWQK